MCTALSINMDTHYFGRTLDLDRSYGEQIVIAPRNYPLPFRRVTDQPSHFALIGMALVMGGMPLYYDAVNEKGLAMAGLNFPGNAVYHPEDPEKVNVAPWEFIPWLLGQCENLSQAREKLRSLNLVNIPFSPQVPLAPLHWIISDKTGALVAESRADGLHIHENPLGVMTNNPPFEYQLMNLNNYRHLDPATPANTLGATLDVYCQGLGGLGLPGDVSSMSRFVRTVFHRQNCVPETDPVGQFFHILGSVEMPRGACRTDAGEWDITVYTSCVRTETGEYFYNTYGNHRIRCVDLRREDLDGDQLKSFPLHREQEIQYEN